MKFISKHIKTEIEEIVQKNDFLLIDFIERGNRNNPIFEIYIDGKSSVSTEDCRKISREIEEIIDKDDTVNKAYRLDVSSPGVDRPLKFLDQFPKNIGRKFELKFTFKDSTKSINAELTGIVNDDKLNFRKDDGEEFLVDFNDIIKAKVLLIF